MRVNKLLRKIRFSLCAVSLIVIIFCLYSLILSVFSKTKHKMTMNKLRDIQEHQLVANEALKQRVIAKHTNASQPRGDNRKLQHVGSEVPKQEVIAKYDQTPQPRGDNRGFQRVTSDGSFYAYSAYYDPRDEPQLRIFVMCTQVYMNITYTCKVQMKTGEIHHVPGAFSIFLTFHAYKYKYVSGVVKCQLSSCCEDWSQLDSVSLYPSKKDLTKYQQNFTIPLNELRILEHKFNIIFPGPKTNKFTRCIAPLHSKYHRAYKLVWNIEISRLSGADKFIFYNFSISPEVDVLLRHYVEEGIAEVRVWNIPNTHQNVYYFAQMIAEHDCLMSQMFASKYVLLADLDEIILPKGGLSVVKMADEVFQYETDTPKSKYGSLVFNCYSFIRRYTNDSIENVPDFVEAYLLKIEPLLYRQYFIPFADSRKALVIPERVDRLCVHNTCYLRRGFKEKRVDPDRKAVMLHYRDKPRHKKENATLYEFSDLLLYSKDIVAAIAERRTRIIW